MRSIFTRQPPQWPSRFSSQHNRLESQVSTGGIETLLPRDSAAEKVTNFWDEHAVTTPGRRTSPLVTAESIGSGTGDLHASCLR